MSVMIDYGSTAFIVPISSCKYEIYLGDNNVGVGKG